MMHKDLYHVLETAHRGAKTGSIHIFGKTEQRKQAHYVIALAKGEIRYMGQSSRPKAIAITDLTNLETISVWFSPRQRNWTTPTLSPTTAAVLACLAQAKETSNSVLPQPNITAPIQTPTSNLRLEATNLLKLLFGTTALHRVAKVGRRFPPEQAPRQFIDGCVQQASQVIGESKAKAMFYRLYINLELSS